MKNYLAHVLIAIAAVILGVAGTLVVVPRTTPSSQPKHLGASIDLKIGDSYATTTSFTASTTAQQILNDNPGVTFRSFSNKTGIPVYLAFVETSTNFSAGNGYELYPSATLTMFDPNGGIWPGQVWAITAAGTSTVSISQF